MGTMRTRSSGWLGSRVCLVAITAFLVACGRDGGQVTLTHWARSYSHANSEVAPIPGNAWPTGDGGYIMVGSLEMDDTVKVDAWIMKLDAGGMVVWAKTYDTGKYDRFSDVQPTEDGGFLVVGQSGSDTGQGGYFLKLDGRGNVTWAKAGTGVGYAVVHASLDGGFVVTGMTPSGRGLYSHDGVVLKLGADGEIVWQKTYVAPGGRGDVRFRAIQPTSNGGYVVAGGTANPAGGALILRLDGSGNIVWQKVFNEVDVCGTYGYCDVRPTIDGGFIVLSSIGAPGSQRAWLTELDSDGNVVWQKGYGSHLSDVRAVAIQPSSDGGYVLALIAWGGDVEYWWDGVLLKVDAKGNMQWQRAYGSERLGGRPGWDVFASIRASADGGYVLSGWTDFPRAAGGNSKAWLLQVDAAGEIPGCAIMRPANLEAIDTDAVANDAKIVATSSNLAPVPSTPALSNNAALATHEQCYAPPTP